MSSTFLEMEAPASWYFESSKPIPAPRRLHDDLMSRIDVRERRGSRPPGIHVF